MPQNPFPLSLATYESYFQIKGPDESDWSPVHYPTFEAAQAVCPPGCKVYTVEAEFLKTLRTK